ncbi:MAG: aminoacyl-tRNA hydrolase [Candidatus Microsaccharimonas sossegonensis]|uniref:Peptidyl-tRNA hydrolase n=1 Tax=Candidatus Microsaccharimonas sossegonensis TaxID=2506948 RepID=A0A4Q0AHH2_9BACT|nr:MAG: aminoacyl-tRNA hydrolase [Candidatus Microsaccharimonas sossegonensis]
MKIIFAQGNPGAKYIHTRHNIGFLVLDAMGEKLDASWRDIDTYKGRIATVIVDGEKVLLVKPLSYYNDTGLVARALVDYYKLDVTKDFLVIHDDLALPFGTIRVRKTGSDAGNNGIKSLNSHLGTEYTRIRVGIWTAQRNLVDDMNFVLDTFPKDEFDTLNKDIIPYTISLIEKFIGGTLEASSVTV